MGVLAQWIREHRPAVMVVDGSVEVTVLSRLFGTPTVVVAHPGDRDDDAHHTAYTVATAVLAPWPAAVRPCRALIGHPRLHTVGGISPLAARPPGNRHRDGQGVLLADGPPAALLDLLADAVPS